MTILGPAAVQELVVFMAWVAVQTPVFKDIKVIIVNSSLVKERSSSSSRVIKATQSS